MKKSIEVEKEMELFDDLTINEVWKKAKPYKRFELYKRDRLGSLMFFDDLGIESENGWVISMIKSKEIGGTLDIKNLEPLHWKNYVNKIYIDLIITKFLSQKSNFNFQSIRYYFNLISLHN